jgi:deoxyribodipyrimidine photo-lyase
MIMRCAFLFRRDLRLFDNTGLNAAAMECDEVMPVFVLDPRQLIKNDYKSNYAISFMLNSISELDGELRKMGAGLTLLEGEAEQVVPDLQVDAIFANNDYTPFAIMRDDLIKKRAERRQMKVKYFHDYLLSDPADFVKRGAPYSVFSHFYNDALSRPVPKPLTKMPRKWFSEETDVNLTTLKDPEIKTTILHGGRTEGLRLLERASGLKYERRNYPAEEQTTMLSAHIKFGTISIREVYHAVSTPIRRQLYWRDFYTLLAYYNPRVFGHSFRREFDCIKWENDERKFKAWQVGLTGFPLVDAGMRELNRTGYMHNRVRMVTAFALVKLLHIDWRLGEKYFATKLIDYDPSVNNGNWQWVASTGTDYMFRLYNPWLQQRKFDPEAIYIKKWIPELREVEKERIHDLEKKPVPGYPRPIVDYMWAIRRAREMYESSARLCEGQKKLED